jgi:mannose-1-phosphate guanylyltransferase
MNINLHLPQVKTLKAVILAGGFATRLRPLSCTRPKILFPILNKPLLQWTLERLTKHKITEAILAVNHTTEIMIRRQKIPNFGVHIKYSRDPLGTPLGTGGPIKKAEKLIGNNEPFLVLNGDIFADVNYTEIIKEHEEKDAVATIALYDVKNPSRYGVAVLTKNNRIKRFIEKPPKGTAPTNLINAGVYVFNPKIFNYLPKGKAVSMEREIFPKLANKGELYGHVFNGLWSDIGKPEDFLKINKVLLASISNKTKIKTIQEYKIVEPIACDKEVTIGENSTIGPYTVIGRKAIIGKSTRIINSIIFPRATISDSVFIENAIIGENTFIGKRVKIGKGCIIGDHVRIKDNISITDNVSICPAKEIIQDVLEPLHII